MELISHSSTYCQTRVGSYGYVPSCQVPKVAASQGPEWVMLIRCGKPSDMLDQAPRSLPRVDERGGRGRQVVKSCLPTLIVGWRTDDHGLFLGLVFFRMVAPPLQPGVVGSFPGTGCMVLQLFTAKGNRLYT
jgi:hypothetical protein